MELRLAAKEDAQGIAAVHIASWKSAYKGIMPDSVLGTLDLENKIKGWERALADEGAPIYVAVDDGIIVGFVHICTYRDGDLGPPAPGEITAIYLRPDVFGVGVGAKLFERALNELAARGYGQVVLWVLEENQRAIVFYQKYGFLPDGGEKVHPKSGLKEIRFAVECAA